MSINIINTDIHGLRRFVNDTDFQASYFRLLKGTEMEEVEYRFLLRNAILFLRADDTNLNKLGYRIALQYSTLTGDWEPTYFIAAAKDYAPVLDLIEKVGNSFSRLEPLAQVLMLANRGNFTLSDGTVRTGGQIRLRESANQEVFAALVAPTSYGKSEMMREQLYSRLGEANVILVPTKSLIAQTQNLLISDPIIRQSSVRIITHPELYLDQKPFIAVMTQERLSRLLRDHPNLAIDQVLVDEAHNLIGDDRRSELISEALLTVLHRNHEARILFFTPFLENPDQLLLVGSQRKLAGILTTEFVKIERYYFSDLATGSLFLYDQFLNKSERLEEPFITTEISVITDMGGWKNLIYLNRPIHVEKVAVELAQTLNDNELPELERIANQIAEYVHPQYQLVETVKKGVLFHHGGMPEVVRLYIEKAFSGRHDGSPRFLVTNSTLLEGVNTPADTLFILNPKRGRQNLTPAAFRNLVGRVGRFPEIFHATAPRPDLLQPRIFVLDGPNSPANFNPKTFLRNVANATVSAAEQARNPLLDASGPSNRRSELLERLENLEPGISKNHQLNTPIRLLQTEAGKTALAHGLDDFDLFTNEQKISRRIEHLIDTKKLITTSAQLIESITQVFLNDMNTQIPISKNLERLRDSEPAQRFYSMFISWLSGGMSLREMVTREIHFFKNQGTDMVFVGSKWGDEKNGDDGWEENWISVASKSDAQLATLAVAKIKDELDFIDFELFRFVEVFHDLRLVEDSFYYQLKYGTEDQDLILLIRNGFSLELAKTLIEKYREYVDLDYHSRTARIQSALIDTMTANSENEILIFEAERLT